MSPGTLFLATGFQNARDAGYYEIIQQAILRYIEAGFQPSTLAIPVPGTPLVATLTFTEHGEPVDGDPTLEFMGALRKYLATAAPQPVSITDPTTNLEARLTLARLA